jgi:hypothetical protein
MQRTQSHPLPHWKGGDSLKDMRKSIQITILALIFITPALAMSKKAPDASPAPAVVTAQPADSVWVGKSDESKSCGTERPVALDAMEAELLHADIKIFAKKKLHDTKMRIQMCGIDKGDLNGFLIAKKDLDKAVGLGFKPVIDSQR